MGPLIWTTPAFTDLKEALVTSWKTGRWAQKKIKKIVHFSNAQIFCDGEGVSCRQRNKKLKEKKINKQKWAQSSWQGPEEWMEAKRWREVEGGISGKEWMETSKMLNTWRVPTLSTVYPPAPSQTKNLRLDRCTAFHQTICSSPKSHLSPRDVEKPGETSVLGC